MISGTVPLLCGLLLIAPPATEAVNYEPGSAKSNKSLEKALIKTLISRYHDSGLIGRPVARASDLMTINFGLAIIQILDLDENGQFLRTNCWMRYAWEDPLLNWTWPGTNDTLQLKRYENITQLRLYPEDVWTPDIRLFNFADTRLKVKRTARIVMYQSGTVLWVPQSLFKSTCEVEIKYFPFDTQTCMLEFGSRTYDLAKINLTWYPYEYEANQYEPNPYIDFTNYIRSHEWITDGQDEFTVRPSMRQRQLKSRMRCKYVITRDENGTEHRRVYQSLVYKIRMRRNPAFYLSILVLPCILLSCLTWVIFWLPPESPAKMLLGMNIFVAFFVLMLLLAKTTPSAVQDFPYIGYFYGFNMVLITLSTFLAAIVLNFYVRAERQDPLNRWLRRWAVDGLGRLFLVRQAVPLKSVAELAANAANAANAAALRSASHQTLSGGLAVSAKSVTDEAGDSPILNMQSVEAGCSSSSAAVAAGNHCGAVEREVREVRQFLKSYVGRLKEKERRNLAAMEWRTLGIVLDRLFFTAYVVCMAAAIIVFIPRGHEPIVDRLDERESDACFTP